MASKSGVSAPQGHERKRAASGGKPKAAKRGRGDRKRIAILTDEMVAADPTLVLTAPEAVVQAWSDRREEAEAERHAQRLRDHADKRVAYDARRRAERTEERGGRPSRVGRGGSRPGSGRKPGPRTLARRASRTHVFL